MTGLFRGAPARFRSPRPRHECLACVNAQTRGGWFDGPGFPGDAGTGRIAMAPGFSVTHVGYRLWFVGRIDRAGEGSELVGLFRQERGAVGGLCGWGLALAALGGGALIGVGFRHAPLILGLGTIGLIAPGAGLYRFGRWQARNDEAVIERVLLDLVGAVRVR